jgi:hypothetical protein
MDTEINFALDSSREPKLELSEGLIPYTDGSVRVKFRTSESDSRFIFGFIAVLMAVGFTFAAMRDGVLTLDFSRAMLVYAFAGIVMILAGWQAFTANEKYHSPMLLSKQGIYHFAFGFLKWDDIKDFYVREVGFLNLRQDERAIHWIIDSIAFEKLISNRNYRHIRSDSLKFYPADNAFDIELNHLDASLEEINQCARYFYFCHRRGVQPVLPWMDSSMEFMDWAQYKTASSTYSIRSDAISRRLKALRNKRAHAVKK